MGTKDLDRSESASRRPRAGRRAASFANSAAGSVPKGSPRASRRPLPKNRKSHLLPCLSVSSGLDWARLRLATELTLEITGTKWHHDERHNFEPPTLSQAELAAEGGEIKTLRLIYVTPHPEGWFGLRSLPCHSINQELVGQNCGFGMLVNRDYHRVLTPAGTARGWPLATSSG